MAEVFIRKDSAKTVGYTVSTMFGHSQVSGDIGIEIECEGNKFPKNGSDLIPNMWCYHQDHSLRGKDNAEYVLKKPILFADVPKALDKLWKMFDDYGTVLDDSNRTSVHIHLNAQKFCSNRLASFAALYFCFEEILTELCGEHRVGNLFCLRGIDAPGIITSLRKFIETDGATELRDNLHYAAFNTNALTKFGSIEIRTMRGTPDKDLILNWVNILKALYEASEKYPDPRAICEDFSGYGPMGFYDKILGEHKNFINSNIPWDYDRISDSLYNGIRIAQELCYCRDWSLFEGSSLSADPFGRNMKKIAKKLSTSSFTETYGGHIHQIASEYPSPEPAPANSSSPPLGTTSSQFVSYALNTLQWHDPESLSLAPSTASAW